jgi:hypothetical protein
MDCLELYLLFEKPDRQQARGNSSRGRSTRTARPVRPVECRSITVAFRASAALSAGAYGLLTWKVNCLMSDQGELIAEILEVYTVYDEPGPSWNIPRRIEARSKQLAERLGAPNLEV